MNGRQGTAVAIVGAVLWIPVALLALPQAARPASTIDPAIVETLLKSSPGPTPSSTASLRRPRMIPQCRSSCRRTPTAERKAAFRCGSRSAPKSARLGRCGLRVVRAVETTGGGNNVAAEESFSGQPGTLREIREFTLAPGNYEAAVAVVHRDAARGWIGTVVRHPFAVSDLWGGGLVVTPVVIGDTVTVARPVERGRAFTFGGRA